MPLDVRDALDSVSYSPSLLSSVKFTGVHSIPSSRLFVKTLNRIGFRLKPYSTLLFTRSHTVQCLNYYPLSLTIQTPNMKLAQIYSHLGYLKQHKKEPIPEESWLFIYIN